MKKVVVFSVLYFTCSVIFGQVALCTDEASLNEDVNIINKCRISSDMLHKEKVNATKVFELKQRFKDKSVVGDKKGSLSVKRAFKSFTFREKSKA